MTYIVGLVDKKTKKVIMGADSAGIGSYHNLHIRKDEKVFRNGNFIIGGTTSFRMLNLLRFKFKVPNIKPKQDVYEYMCTDFIDEVRKMFADNGFMQKEKNGDDLGGDFLVAYKNRLFIVHGDFQVGENYAGYQSIGCGGDYALGSLFATKGVEDSEFRVQQALSAAEYLSAGVSAPFVILTT